MSTIEERPNWSWTTVEVGTGLQGETGGAVAQVVEADRWQATGGDEFGEVDR